MRKFFELLQSKGSIAIIGLLIGLFLGFRVANARYRSTQTAVRDAAALKAAQQGNAGDANHSGGGGMQGDTAKILDQARANPNDFDAQMAAADQFLQIQRPEGALSFLTQANKLQPDDTRPMTGLATANLMMGKAPEAIQWARTSLKKKPEDLGSKVLLMFALIEARQNLNEAEKLLAEIEKVKPNDNILGDARRALAEARSGSSSPPASETKTTLDHGPAVEKPKVK